MDKKALQACMNNLVADNDVINSSAHIIRMVDSDAARIAALEAELADARTANEMAAKHFKEFEQDGATIRDLREKLDAIRTEYAEYKNIVAEAAHADGLKIYNLELDLIFANRAASANLRMAKEQAQKVGALKMAIIKIAGICNAELFDCEDVKREDLIDTVQAYFDIQQITDGILEATK